MNKTEQLRHKYTPDIELLQSLYKIRSFSYSELPMTTFIKHQLDSMGVWYEEHNGNIINLFVENQPILSAHQDMVDTFPAKTRNPVKFVANWVTKAEPLGNNTIHRFKFKKGNIKAYNKRNERVSLGADDKNGIFAILELLKLGYRFNFIFSIGEEVGCIGINEVLAEEEYSTLVSEKPYAIVIDRRNADDIIGFKNQYCVGLDHRLEQFSEKEGFSFKCSEGMYSDADHISDLVECVNISCGYYKAHSSEEYTNVEELANTIVFLARVLDDFRYESLPVDRYKGTAGFKDDWDWGSSYYGYDYGTSTTKVKDKFYKDSDLEEINTEANLLCQNCQVKFNVMDIYHNDGMCPSCYMEMLSKFEMELVKDEIEKGEAQCVIEYERAYGTDLPTDYRNQARGC